MIVSKVVRILTYLYEGSESCASVGLEHTDRFSVDTAVIHGSSLSLILFNVVLDFVLSNLRTTDCGIEWVCGERLKNLDFADDI